MSLYTSSRHKTRSSCKSSLGHLKLSVYEESSCLVVEVYEARCLAKKESNSAETYVKLYILPDPSKSTKQKTKMCKGKDPTYNEKFNFLLENGDEAKQLYISVWVHDRGSRNELIGCMSFRIVDILQSEKKIHGWYQLLDRERGLTENARVQSLRVPTQQGPSETPSTQVNGRTFAVTLARGPSGYGFSVHSSHPVYITAVDEGLAAHIAGVKVNDVLVELEGIDVRHASGKQVVNIIRRCRDTLAMILLRCGPNFSLNRSQSIGDGLTAASLSISLSPTLFSSQSDIPRVEAKRRLSNVEQISDIGYGSTSSLNAMMHRTHAPRRNSLSPEPLLHLKQPSSNSSIEEEYELTADSHTGHAVGRPVHLVVEGTHHSSLSKLNNKTSAPSSQESLPAPPQHQKYLSMSSLATGAHQNSPQHVNLSYHTQLSSSGDSLDGGHISFIKKGIHKFSNYDSVVSSTHNVQLLSAKKLKSDEHLDVRWEDLTPKEKRQQKAIDELVKFEMQYCTVLKAGVKGYKEPIAANKVIPSPQMHNIFTNIDELYEISNGICAMLKQKQKPYADTAPLSYHIDTFADVYKLKWLHMKNSYEIYLKCFSAASQELSLSLIKPDMTRFLQQITTKDQNLPSLHHILDQPRQYLMELLKHLINVDSHTRLQSKDHQPIMQLINDLLELCPDKQLVSKYRRQLDIMGNLKLRIGFSSAVQPTVVVTPGRIFIQEGEMFLLEKKKKRKIWLLLFSDLLLITRKDGKIFTVQEEAIQLDDVRLTSITGGNDLHLHVKEKEITFRAISPAVQTQWQNKLLELLVALRPVGAPHGNVGHEAHVNSINKVMGKEDERTSQLAKMTRIADAQKDDVTDSRLLRGVRRRTLFNITKSNVAKQKTPARRTASESTATVPDQKQHTFERISPEVLKMWSSSFDALLQNPDGVALFEQYLVTEFSEENLQFWQACKRYQTSTVNNSSLSVLVEARAIYNEFLVQGAPKQVNVDHETLAEVSRNIDRADHMLFEKAQKSVYSLMSIDSYKRFVQSSAFQQALHFAK